MARTTEAEVLGIITTSVTPLTPFIDAANAVVDDNLLGHGLTEDRLKLIETWLAAHFLAVRDRRISREEFGDAIDWFDGKTAMGLDFTGYGQQVRLLDPTGILARVDKLKSIVFEVL